MQPRTPLAAKSCKEPGFSASALHFRTDTAALRSALQALHAERVPPRAAESNACAHLRAVLLHILLSALENLLARLLGLLFGVRLLRRLLSGPLLVALALLEHGLWHSARHLGPCTYLTGGCRLAQARPSLWAPWRLLPRLGYLLLIPARFPPEGGLQRRQRTCGQNEQAFTCAHGTVIVPQPRARICQCKHQPGRQEAGSCCGGDVLLQCVQRWRACTSC